MLSYLNDSFHKHLVAREMTSTNQKIVRIEEPDPNSKNCLIEIISKPTSDVMGLQLNNLSIGNRHRCKATNLFIDGAEHINKLSDAVVFSIDSGVLYVIVIEMKSLHTDTETNHQLNNSMSLANYIIELFMRAHNLSYKQIKFARVIFQLKKRQGKYHDIIHNYNKYWSPSVNAYKLNTTKIDLVLLQKMAVEDKSIRFYR